MLQRSPADCVPMPTLDEQITGLQARVESLNQKIADGVRQVTIGGDTTVLNTTDSLRAARDDVLRQLATLQAQQAGQPRQRMTRLFYSGRGY